MGLKGYGPPAPLILIRKLWFTTKILLTFQNAVIPLKLDENSPGFFSKVAAFDFFQDGSQQSPTMHCEYTKTIQFCVDAGEAILVSLRNRSTKILYTSFTGGYDAQNGCAVATLRSLFWWWWWNLPRKIKTQYVQFRLHTNHFLFP